MNCQIIKILLQPLVENAIVHGILEREGEEKGNIIISGEKYEDAIFIDIVDDGIGIDPQQMKELLSKTMESTLVFGILINAWKWLMVKNTGWNTVLMFLMVYG